MSIFETFDSSVKNTYPLKVVILGSTGSVGTQAIDVCRNHPDKLQVVGLAAQSSTQKLVEQALEFGVQNIAIADESRKHDTCLAELSDKVDVSFGQESVFELAGLPEADVVLISVVGAIGMRACYEALRAGKKIAVANKEPLVVAGDILMPLAKPGMFLPVDSEHSAIYQCILGEKQADIHKIWLTCSGGPFYGYSKEDLAHVTVEQALKHPSWSMGSKITIDSATLMNKGFEVIEAQQLFGVGVQDVEVLVHRESKIHSMVEYTDGQVKALLGASDMRGAIQYAFSYPERWESSIKHLDYRFEPTMSFAPADEDAFGCLRLAREAGRIGGTLPCAMNAANEVVNEAFRHGSCSFLDIERTIEHVMDQCSVERVESLEHIEEVDALARERARAFLQL